MDWTDVMVAIVSALSTLGGVWIGIWLSEHSARQREVEAAAERAQAVQTLLRVEIDANLHVVNAIWSDISDYRQKSPYNNSNWNPANSDDWAYVALMSDLLRRFATNVQPAFTRSALDSQFTALPDVPSRSAGAAEQALVHLGMDWTQIILGLITLGGTLGGVWLGHRWAEDAARQREAHAEEQQARAVRAIVRLEIQSNLDSIRLRLSSLSKKAGDHSSDMTESEHLTDHDREYRENLRLAQALVDDPLAPFDRLALESQLGALPTALTDAGVLAVLTVYKNMSRLEIIQRQLIALHDEQEAAWKEYINDGQRPTDLAYIGPATPFNFNARKLWSEYAQLANTLIENGNPLGEQSSEAALPLIQGNEQTEDDVPPPASPS